MEHSKRADGVTTNVDNATANVNGVTANVEEMSAVKHSQGTAVVANGGQEMRALGTGDDQDDLRWRSKQGHACTQTQTRIQFMCLGIFHFEKPSLAMSVCVLLSFARPCRKRFRRF